MPADQLKRPTIGWILKTHISKRNKGNISEATLDLVCHRWPEPTFVKYLLT
jgi:hypothetical protein